MLGLGFLGFRMLVIVLEFLTPDVFCYRELQCPRSKKGLRLITKETKLKGRL